jgi:hypothetical protein
MAIALRQKLDQSTRSALRSMIAGPANSSTQRVPGACLRPVEEMLLERGIVVSCETVRCWAKFGPEYAGCGLGLTSPLGKQA